MGLGTEFRNTKDIEGALSLVLATVLVLISMTGFGFWGLMRDWRRQVELQLRLNRCVGKTAQVLRDYLNTIAALNSEIERVRSEIKALEEIGAETSLNANIVTLGQELAQSVLKQEEERVRWEERTGQVGCSRMMIPSLPKIEPEVRIHRPPADHVGPQPLVWAGQIPQSFQIQFSHQFRDSMVRNSMATVTGGSLERQFNTRLWTSFWGQSGTNIR